MNQPVSDQDRFTQAFARIHGNHPEIDGALLATEDGLVMVAEGRLQDEAAAAGASSLGAQADAWLQGMGAGPCQEAVFWTGSRTLCLVRLAAGGWLMTSGEQRCLPGVLRIAAGTLGEEFRGVLETK